MIKKIFPIFFLFSGVFGYSVYVGEKVDSYFQKHCRISEQCVFKVGNESIQIPNDMYLNLWLENPFEQIQYTWIDDDIVEKGTIRDCQKIEKDGILEIHCQKKHRIYFSQNCQPQIGIEKKNHAIFQTNQSGCVFVDDFVVQKFEFVPKEEVKIYSSLRETNRGWFLFIKNSGNQNVSCRIETNRGYVAPFDRISLQPGQYFGEYLEKSKYSKESAEFPQILLKCGEYQKSVYPQAKEKKQNWFVWIVLGIVGVFGYIFWETKKRKEEEKLETQIENRI